MLTPLFPLQSLSDFGKHRKFFRKSGEPVPFVSIQQLGTGAPQATSPEVVAASVDGPDQDAGAAPLLWALMRGCDVWALGRMMYELLLQSILKVQRIASGVGLPPLGAQEYKDEDLPPLPGYSAGLRRLLVAMMTFDPERRLDAT